MEDRRASSGEVLALRQKLAEAEHAVELGSARGSSLAGRVAQLEEYLVDARRCGGVPTSEEACARVCLRACAGRSLPPFVPPVPHLSALKSWHPMLGAHTHTPPPRRHASEAEGKLVEVEAHYTKQVGCSGGGGRTAACEAREAIQHS